MKPHSPPSGQLNLYQPTPNPETFIAILFTLHKHMAPHSITPNATNLKHPLTPTAVIPSVIYPWQYDHSSCTCFLCNTSLNHLTLLLKTDK